MVAVNENSEIYKLSDLEGKNLAVQSTTKPEDIFLNRTDEWIPKLGNLISLGHRELIYTFLGKGYVDAAAAHEESIVQYMKDYDTSFRSRLYIYTCRYTILIQIIVWWIVVAAEGNHRLFCFLFRVICIFTPCQGDC